MIITRQDPMLFRLQTGETVFSFHTDSCAAELKINNKRLDVNTPGEYEMEGIALEGMASNGMIFYTVHWDDMVIGLGGTTSRIPYDILLLFVAKTPEAAKALADSDARIVMPFGEEKAVVSFLKELDESPEEMEKLTIKKKDIPAEGERKIVILKPLKK